MFSVLFHRDVFLPQGFESEVINLERKMRGYFLSHHFEEHLNNQSTEDRSHTYLRNAVINNLNEMISDFRVIRKPFEVEVSKDYHFFGKPGWFVTKYCIRLQYTKDQDLVVVLRPMWNALKHDYDYAKFMVTTAWLNHANDNQHTLDESKYTDESKWNLINSHR